MHYTTRGTSGVKSHLKDTAIEVSYLRTIVSRLGLKPALRNTGALVQKRASFPNKNLRGFQKRKISHVKLAGLLYYVVNDPGNGFQLTADIYWFDIKKTKYNARCSYSLDKHLKRSSWTTVVYHSGRGIFTLKDIQCIIHGLDSFHTLPIFTFTFLKY